MPVDAVGLKSKVGNSFVEKAPAGCSSEAAPNHLDSESSPTHCSPAYTREFLRCESETAAGYHPQQPSACCGNEAIFLGLGPKS